MQIRKANPRLVFNKQWSLHAVFKILAYNYVPQANYIASDSEYFLLIFNLCRSLNLFLRILLRFAACWNRSLFL
jgi:hypothetical protein